MYWSGYDTLVLLSGIGFFVAALIPIPGVEQRYRVTIGILGVFLVIGSFITGNMQSFTYPAGIELLPVVLLVVIIVGGVQAYRRANPSAPAPAVIQNFAVVSHQELPPAEVPPSPLAVAAADPATDLAQLAALAHEHPELRPLVAANPSTYPGLLEWLAQFDDAEIQAALNAR